MINGIFVIIILIPTRNIPASKTALADQFVHRGFVGTFLIGISITAIPLNSGKDED